MENLLQKNRDDYDRDCEYVLFTAPFMEMLKTVIGNIPEDKKYWVNRFNSEILGTSYTKIKGERIIMRNRKGVICNKNDVSWCTKDSYIEFVDMLKHSNIPYKITTMDSPKLCLIYLSKKIDTTPVEYYMRKYGSDELILMFSWSFTS